MTFLIPYNDDIWFPEEKLIWESYIVIKALPITKKIELILNLPIYY